MLNPSIQISRSHERVLENDTNNADEKSEGGSKGSGGAAFAGSATEVDVVGDFGDVPLHPGGPDHPRVRQLDPGAIHRLDGHALCRDS